VREAAARAWANSDTQPLPALAPYMHDPLVRSLVIAAAARRGQEPATMEAMIQHRPAAEADASQLRQAWQQAMVNMGTRLPPEAVLAGHKTLANLAEPAQFRQQFLSGAIERVAGRRVNGDAALNAAQAAATDGLLCDLLLARGQARLAAGSFDMALEDYRRIQLIELRITAAQRRGAQLGAIEAYLELDRLDDAVKEAEAALALPQPRETPTLDAVSKVFTTVAERKSKTNMPQAQLILQRLAKLWGSDIPEAIMQEITRISSAGTMP
jgi:tetratricopeptide (TPR) repeat protein